ncbi:MAG: Altered inheritance of mitochondria protein 24, mitochondrial [Icmadophila ericetorum]|nr:Altered inheritance of mitochondria protein 24, mitochondrial [Icmadophila ericetorum]
MRHGLRQATGGTLNHLNGSWRLTSPYRNHWRSRKIHVSTIPSSLSPTANSLPAEPTTITNAESPDAQFEVLGAPYSLLSISLSASQALYTRRGTLVGVSGRVENAVSTLSVLEPFRRLALGIPFLYQKIISTSSITALISTKSPITSFAVVHLNGTVDWMVAQRQALLAWTGHSLLINPTLNRRMSLAHWGNSKVTGRGLLGLIGKGNIYQIVLKEGEEYVAHPSNVVAYTITQHPPLPYRLKSSVLRFQVPNLGFPGLVPDTKFMRVMRESATWKALMSGLFHLRTWSRRTIWGDRLFLHFHGPTTILLQTRASRLNDVLTARDVNEIADTPTGVVQKATFKANPTSTITDEKTPGAPAATIDVPTKLSVATIGKDGKVSFQETDDFKSLSR